MSDLLHFGDLMQVALDAGLFEAGDVTEWLRERGVCPEGVSQYGSGVVSEALLDNEHDEKWRIEGAFNSGLSLGVALGQRLALIEEANRG